MSERVRDRFDRTPETWFKRAAVVGKQEPEMGGAKKSSAYQAPDWIGKVRQQWAELANGALEQAKIETRIDHRSHADRGLESLPSVHEGPTVRRLVEDGRVPAEASRMDLNREIQSIPDRFAQLHAEQDALEKERAELIAEHERAVEAERAAAAEAKVIERATTDNATLLAIAKHVEQMGAAPAKLSKQQMAVLCDALFRPDQGRLHGESARARGLFSQLEIGARERADNKAFISVKMLSFHVTRTTAGFEYVIQAVKEKVTELVAYLRDAAAHQLKRDSSILRAREGNRIKQLQQPSRKPITREQGRGGRD